MQTCFIGKRVSKRLTREAHRRWIMIYGMVYPQLPLITIRIPNNGDYGLAEVVTMCSQRCPSLSPNEEL